MKKIKSMMAIVLSLVMMFSMNVQAATTDKRLEAAKNPGLGVRALHKQGITGKGVSIAYIGYGIQNGDISKFTHSEWDTKQIKGYVNLGHGSKPTPSEAYRGTSMMIGKTVGTAPDANLYMLGMNVKRGKSSQWKPVTDGINWVIEKNKTLSGSDKIRVIVVDTAPGGDYDAWTNLTPLYDKAIANAQKAGIIVLSTRWHDPAVKQPPWGNPQPNLLYSDEGYYDINNPDDISKAKHGQPKMTDYYTHKIIVHAPDYGRTLATANDSYAYTVNTYTSDSYLAGIIAMGYQVNPNLSNTQMAKLLINTKASNHMVNPPKFIEAVKKTVQ